MNIFILDNDLNKSAQLMCDQHLRKQILENAQILCTVRHILYPEDVIPYKPTHKNHPVTKWALESSNFQFLLMYNWLILGNEYMHRFNKPHKSSTILIQHFNEHEALVNTTSFPIRNDLNYYKEKLLGWLTRDKPLIAKWTNRQVPDFYQQILEQRAL